MHIDQQLLDALTALWRAPPLQPQNLRSVPAFAKLSELFAERSGGRHVVIALSNALRSLGLPSGAEVKTYCPAVDLRIVAKMLVEGFFRTSTIRRHICPLDLADDLPPMTFGNARVARFGANELEQLFDFPRL